MQRVQFAFEISNIVQLCQNQHMFTDARYPCVDREKGIIVDKVTMEPLSKTAFTFRTPDGTARIPICDSPAYPIVPTHAAWSRCDDILKAVGQKQKF